MHLKDVHQQELHGILIFSSDVHCWNALFPIDVTEEGMIIVFNEFFPLKVLFFIEIIDLWIYKVGTLIFWKSFESIVFLCDSKYI